MTDESYDIAVIGGGINGAGIARDAAGRGLSVVLLEQNDLASGTSSASSKLIHGGLRYLEHWEFRLVREALEEREVLLAAAPHVIWPLRFVLPHMAGMRSQPLLRAGLFLYDHLAARRTIPASSAIDLARDPAGRPLVPDMRRAFSYWDCWVDDARLVVLNARSAADHGARILTRARVTGASRMGALWRIEVKTQDGPAELSARVLVNAAGPWAGALEDRLSPEARRATALPRIRLVKGSHIVLPRIAGAEDAYLLQNTDGRVVFALPFEERFTLIGTTDVPYEGDPAATTLSADEHDYLLAVAKRYFGAPASRDVVWSYSGVRPLIDDGSADPAALSRDYRLEVKASDDKGAPVLLNVWGGKVTTYRRLAEAALRKLAPALPSMGPAWTAHAPLPGGDAGSGGMDGYRLALLRRFPAFTPQRLARLVRRYGTRTSDLLDGVRHAADLGDDLGAGLTAREVAFLKETEWALTPDDILWRRTKTGLHLTPSERARAADRIARLL